MGSLPNASEATVGFLGRTHCSICPRSSALGFDADPILPNSDDSADTFCIIKQVYRTGGRSVEYYKLDKDGGGDQVSFEQDGASRLNDNLLGHAVQCGRIQFLRANIVASG